MQLEVLIGLLIGAVLVAGFYFYNKLEKDEDLADLGAPKPAPKPDPAPVAKEPAKKVAPKKAPAKKPATKKAPAKTGKKKLTVAK